MDDSNTDSAKSIQLADRSWTLSLADALVFDLDGTLYDQAPVRRGMFWRLLSKHLRQPVQGVSTVRSLRAYRNAQDFLRSAEFTGDDISETQIEIASRWTGVKKGIVASNVARWMEEEPLDLIAESTWDGVTEFLQAAKDRHLRLAVFSDYPATAKLAAMRLTQFFDVVVTAQDPEVQRFKPDPRGIDVLLRRLGVEKNRAIYIGDRPNIDALAASRAGIRCVIIGRKRHKGTNPPFWMEVSDYQELYRLFGYQ